MKRSEAVEEILNIICKNVEYEGVVPFYFSDLSDDILNRLEELGMLPPPTTISNTDEDNNPIWEPEDED